MKNFIKSFRLTLVFCVFFSVCYILVLWIFAQFAGPNSGNAEVVELNGKVVAKCFKRHYDNEKFLSKIRNKLVYEMWLCGHFHLDRTRNS